MSSAPTNPVEVPPFQLQSLIDTVFEQEPSDVPRRASREAPPHVTCAQALGSEVYAGCSNGQLLRFALQADNPYAPESYSLLSRQSLPDNKPINKLGVLACISRLLVLSNNTVYIYTLPNLDPVPPTVIRPIKNVVNFVVDAQHLRRPPHSLGDPYTKVDPVEFCVIKRSAIWLYSLHERLHYINEISLPGGASVAQRTGHALMVADKDNYNLVDLKQPSFIPLMPISQGLDSDAPVKPLISVVNDQEFLVCSWSGTNTIGLFINTNGDPVRGTLQWPSHPEAICVDYPYVAALLKNRTIEIHSVESQEIVQVLVPASSPPSKHLVEPIDLAASLTGYMVPSSERTEKLAITAVPLQQTFAVESDFSTMSTSSVRQFSARPPVFPHSNVMVIGINGIDSLVPSTLISQADSLLDGHRIEEAVDLADQQRKKLQSSLTVDQDRADELRYVYQRIGFQCLKETLFEDAGKHLFAGDLDPRALMRFFPDLRGNLFSLSTVDMFAGVAEHMPQDDSVDDIVMASLVRNYSPHMSPNTRSAPPTAELRKILNGAAREMLETYLRRWRTKRKVDPALGATHAPDINTAVDTVLVKLLAESEKTTDLYNLLEESGDITPNEVEPVLIKTGQYNALCRLYQKRGDDSKLLDAWAKVADGEWMDSEIPDPLDNMFVLLKGMRDKSVVNRWAVWMVKRDPKRGAQLIMSRRDKKRMAITPEELEMLRQIRDENPEIGNQISEDLVLQTRSTDRELHNRVAMSYVDQLLGYAKDESVSKLWRAKTASYFSSRNEAPFISYFASTTPESPSKRTRLKAALFLQGSSLYDLEEARQKLETQEKFYQLELAIIDGKLGRHREALSALVLGLRDSVSAEGYCTLGGDVISSKAALAIGKGYDLQTFSTLFDGGSASATTMKRQKTADEDVKKELLHMLLEVYMSGGDEMAGRTARLLNSQAVNLDVADVVSLVPPEWSVNVMSNFLARSFRRTLHQSQEGMIIKQLAAAQHRKAMEVSYKAFREYGAVIEEPASDDEGGDVVTGEKEILDEKVVLVNELAVAQIQLSATDKIRKTASPGTAATS